MQCYIIFPSGLQRKGFHRATAMPGSGLQIKLSGYGNYCGSFKALCFLSDSFHIV